MTTPERDVSAAGLSEAEREGLMRGASVWHRGVGADALVSAVEAIISARMAPIEALADEWEAAAPKDSLALLLASNSSDYEACGYSEGLRTTARQLRAALIKATR